VAEKLCRELGVRRSVSATTRKRRPNETQGVDYHFVSEQEFRRRVAQGEFLEHAEVHGNLYGTPRGPVEEAITSGETLLLVIDVQGAMQVKECFPEAIFVFLDAPDEATLAERLAGRSTEAKTERDRRRSAASTERQYKEHYDYHVINDHLDRAVAELSVIVRSGRKPEHRRPRLDG
jgi:guanylate kinase